MTTDELKKEAEEAARQHWLAYPLKQEIFKQGYLAGAEPREKRIAELEKENTNLRVSVENTRCAGIELLSDKRKQLTKAKKLLNEFLDFESSCMERGIYISDKIRAEAKQFLKDSEVEK